MSKDIDYENLVKAGFTMVPQFVETLNHNLHTEQAFLLDVQDAVNHYFALFILYHASLSQLFSQKPEAKFPEKFRMMIFFQFSFSIYQSVMSYVILRLANQIDSGFLVLRTIIEKCGLAQHFILHPLDYPKWKQGDHIAFTGKKGVVTRLLNQKYVKKITQTDQDISIDEKISQELLSLYKECSEVVHNRITELDGFQKIWAQYGSREAAFSEMDQYYIYHGDNFFQTFPPIMDMVTLSLTYNAYLITEGKLFELSKHRDKIDELLDAFPNTKLVFMKKLENKTEVS